MNLREAAEHLLEAWDKGTHSVVDAITALRAALAEPEAEPVAWMESPYGEIRRNPLYKIAAPQSVEWSIPLYAALAEPPPSKNACVYPQCVSTTRTQCEAWALGACEERQ